MANNQSRVITINVTSSDLEKLHQVNPRLKSAIQVVQSADKSNQTFEHRFDSII